MHAGLGFAECTARVTPIADDELTVVTAYVKEREQVQTRGWVYYAFNVTDEDYQVVVNVAEEEGSQCKLLCPQPLMPEGTLSCLPVHWLCMLLPLPCWAACSISGHISSSTMLSWATIEALEAVAAVWQTDTYQVLRSSC